MQWLHKHGVEVGAVDMDGATALHVAAAHGSVGATKWLVKVKNNARRSSFWT